MAGLKIISIFTIILTPFSIVSPVLTLHTIALNECLIYGLTFDNLNCIENHTKEDVMITLISRENISTEMVSVKIKVTNVGTKHINSCLSTCILYDGTTEVAFQKHYIIRSIDGGLDINSSTYFEYIIDVPNTKYITGLRFQIDIIN